MLPRFHLTPQPAFIAGWGKEFLDQSSMGELVENCVCREIGEGFLYWHKSLGRLPRGGWFLPLQCDPLGQSEECETPTMLQLLVHFMRVYRLQVFSRLNSEELMKKVPVYLGGDESLGGALALVRFFSHCLLYRNDEGILCVESPR